MRAWEATLVAWLEMLTNKTVINLWSSNLSYLEFSISSQHAHTWVSQADGGGHKTGRRVADRGKEVMQTAVEFIVEMF